MDAIKIGEILNDCHRYELPPVQRGFVWKPHQIEMLWDSVLCGFPIGSFIIDGDDNYLLDGQQRFLSLALASVEPGKGVQEIGKASEGRRFPICLWIDLAGPPQGDDYHREFCFRVVIRAHPWGFRRKTPEQKLSPTECAEAWKEMGGAESSTEISDDVWRKAFLKDAVFPVPFYIFLKQDFPTNPGEFYEFLKEESHGRWHATDSEEGVRSRAYGRPTRDSLHAKEQARAR